MSNTGGNKWTIQQKKALSKRMKEVHAGKRLNLEVPKQDKALAVDLLRTVAKLLRLEL